MLFSSTVGAGFKPASGTDPATLLSARESKTGHRHLSSSATQSDASDPVCSLRRYGLAQSHRLPQLRNQQIGAESHRFFRESRDDGVGGIQQSDTGLKASVVLRPLRGVVYHRPHRAAARTTPEGGANVTDLILKGGDVLDPSRGPRAKLDVAVTDGLVSEVAPDIQPDGAARVIDVSGKLVTPGLIDLHTHVYEGVNQTAVNPDLAGVLSGVTTVVDAGSAGCYTFGGFPQYVVPNASTRIFCMVHISRTGLNYQPEISDRDDIDLEETVRVVQANRPLVQGIKLRAVGPAVPVLGIEMFNLAKRAARESGVRLMVHIGDRFAGDGPTLTQGLLPLMDEGDIITHLFSGNPGRILDGQGNVLPEVLEAQERGVFLDTAHGRQNFSFDVARRALDQGVRPAEHKHRPHHTGQAEHRAQHDRDALPLHGAGLLAGGHHPHGDAQPGAGHRHGRRARQPRAGPHGRHNRAGGGDRRLALPRHRGRHPQRRQGARAGAHRQRR